MIYMIRFAGLVCAVAAVVFFASCRKDKESGTIAFDSPAVFLNAGDAVTVGFSASNIESFSITGKPTGWSDPVIDAANRTITVISPEKFDDDNDAVKSGSVTLTGKVHGGSTASATLFVGVVDTEDLSDKQANSYLINKKETNYLIDAMYKGDVTELATSSVDVVWQSRSNLIQYLELKDGKASFYVAADSDDGDKIKEGNAVIGAYDAGGTLIWSWHVWAADYDPDAEGGAVDFTGNEEIDYWETVCDEVRVCKGIRRMLDAGVNPKHITISSDGQGSLPIFNEKGEFLRMGMGQSSCLLKEVKECVEKAGIPLETAISTITANPAEILSLKGKGKVREGYDADLCVLDQGLEIQEVVARGKTVYRK